MRWGIVNDDVRYSFGVKGCYEGFKSADYYFAVNITLEDIGAKSIIPSEKA